MSGTVLIVDDDPEVARTFATWLQLQGYEVRTASDGEAALRQPLPFADLANFVTPVHT